MFNKWPKVALKQELVFVAILSSCFVKEANMKQIVVSVSLLMIPRTVVFIELVCTEFSNTVMCLQSEKQKTENTSLRHPYA